jgi:hypothetical protein
MSATETRRARWRRIFVDAAKDTLLDIVRKEKLQEPSQDLLKSVMKNASDNADRMDLPENFDTMSDDDVASGCKAKLLRTLASTKPS